MLGRRREQILIIGGLIGLNILLGWLLGGLSKEYRSRTRWIESSVTAEPAPTSAAGPTHAGHPQSFVDIVDRNVFSPLRGSLPAQPQGEEARAPKLPLLFGTMNLGNGRFALMSPGDQPSSVSRRVLPGEEIGGYKLVSIGTSNVVLEWQEKKFTLEITAPVNRGPNNIERPAGVRPAVGVPAGASAANASNPVINVGPAGGAASAAAASMAPAGVPPDAPVGTVVGGKRKVLVPTPYGTVVQWQDVGPSGSQAPQRTNSPNQ